MVLTAVVLMLVEPEPFIVRDASRCESPTRPLKRTPPPEVAVRPCVWFSESTVLSKVMPPVPFVFNVAVRSSTTASLKLMAPDVLTLDAFRRVVPVPLTVREEGRELDEPEPMLPLKRTSPVPPLTVSDSEPPSESAAMVPEKVTPPPALVRVVFWPSSTFWP